MPVLSGKPNGFPHDVNVRTLGGALFELKLVYLRNKRGPRVKSAIVYIRTANELKTS